MGKLGIMARAGLVLGSVSVLAVAATFALSSTATLTDNSISSATASLLVDGPDVDAVATASETGFTFANLIPGADYGTAQTFSLHNEGTSDLDVTVYATVGTLTGVLNKNKVHVKITNTTPTTPVSDEYTLAELEALFNPMPGVSDPGFLPMDDTTTTPDDEGVNTFEIQVKMDADAVSSGSATLNDFDLVFTGTAVVPE